MRRGDIIVNPWVSVDYCGELNPMYATIYLGNNFSLDYKGRKHTWADKVYKENVEHRCPWKVIGHIDLDDIIETAIRKAVKTENSSEKPNNCEKDCFLCKWLGEVDVCGRCRNRNLFAEADTEPKPKDEPQICGTCRYYNSNIPCGSTPSACKEADKFAEEFVDGLKKLKLKVERSE